MAGIELINTLVKFKKTVDDGSVKNYISMAGALSSLNSAVSTYRLASLKVAGATEGTILSLTKYSKVTGLFGSGISVVMCVWDTVDSIKVSDYDAAIAWGFTAVVSGVLFVDGVFATGAWLFGVAYIGFLSFGLVLFFSVLFIRGIVFAIYLTDEPLEKFLKNNILSNERKLRVFTRIPHVYVKELIDKKDDLVDDEVSKWRDFTVASDDLYDLLISYKVGSKLKNPVCLDEKIDPSFWEKIKDLLRAGLGTKIYVAETVEVKISLRKFIPNQSEFSYAIALFPKEVKFNTQQEPLYITDTKASLEQKDGLNILSIKFILDEYMMGKIGLGSEFMLFSKTLVNTEFNESWPSQRGKTRYHAYKFEASQLPPGVSEQAAMDHTAKIIIGNIATYLGGNVRVGTVKELIHPTTWK